MSFGSGCQLDHYLRSLDDTSTPTTTIISNDKSCVNVHSDDNNYIISILYDIIISLIYKNCPSLQYHHHHHHHYHHRYGDDQKQRYVLMNAMIIMILLIVLIILVLTLSRMVLLLFLVLLLLVSMPYIIGYYCIHIITKVTAAYDRVDFLSSELLLVLKRLQLVSMGRALTNPLPSIYQEVAVEAKNLSFKEVRDRMYILMTNTMVDAISINNDINGSKSDTTTKYLYSSSTIVTSALLRQVKSELLSMISSTISSVISIISSIDSDHIGTGSILNRFCIFVYHLHHLMQLIERY